jgi:transposase
MAGQLPAGLGGLGDSLLEVIGKLTEQIRRFDREVERFCRQEYPETELLRQVQGVGPLTSLAYVLVLEDPGRFERARSVGNYVGLCPAQDDSGEQSPQLRISKEGDSMLRRLLVGSAQYLLGPHGMDSDLRRWGLKLAARGGKNAKKRAVVAVARKLAVLLYVLWSRGEVYEPLRGSGEVPAEPVCALTA